MITLELFTPFDMFTSMLLEIYHEMHLKCQINLIKYG